MTGVTSGGAQAPVHRKGKLFVRCLFWEIGYIYFDSAVLTGQKQVTYLRSIRCDRNYQTVSRMAGKLYNLSY